MVVLNMIRIIIGAALLIFGAVQLGTSIWLTAKGIQTEGMVSSYVNHPVGYAPVVDYTTAEGRRVRFESRMRPSVETLAADSRMQSVKLYYDPSNPEFALLADPSDMWVWPGSIFFFGMVVTAIGPLARLMWGD